MSSSKASPRENENIFLVSLMHRRQAVDESGRSKLYRILAGGVGIPNVLWSLNLRDFAESGLARTLFAKAGHLVEGADFRSTSTHAVSEPSGF